MKPTETMKAEKQYKYVDEVFADFNKQIPKYVNNIRIRLLTFDEINAPLVRRLVKREYKKIIKKAKSNYLEIAKRTYKEAYDYAVALGFKDGELKPFTLAMINDWLLEYDAITGYVFDNEVERKQERLVENTMGLLVADKSLNAAEAVKKYKMAAKYIKDQVNEYADEIAYMSMEKAYKDCKVKKVRWLSEYDNRVCDECLSLSGLVFPIDRVPPKPHWGCRCWLVPEK